MSCWHYYAPSQGGDGAFSMDASSIVFGAGALGELGDHVAALGCRRVALFTDERLAKTAHFARARRSLQDASIDFAVYEQVHVEPTDAWFLDAARFAREANVDGYVSVGGGSVIDTCKAAALYATYPAEFLAYVNRPVGEGRAVPGPLPPHVACPTTCGTGSETTGIAVCDIVALHAKTGIASRRLRPTMAIVDPDATDTLPPEVIAASGFDVLCHALESFTARPHARRARPQQPTLRPMSQGANPWSDLGSREALRLTGESLVRAVSDPTDREARRSLSWAATLAGVAFGNAGVHVPHAMAYAIAGLVRDFRMPGYPAAEPMVPHGVSVILGAPATFRFTSGACPDRHLEGAALLGADVRGARDTDAGEILAKTILDLMRRARVPLALREVGYGEADVPALVAGTAVQRRLLDNAPVEVHEPELERLFRASIGGAR